jgi:hypothetical protein
VGALCRSLLCEAHPSFFLYLGTTGSEKKVSLHAFQRASLTLAPEWTFRPPKEVDSIMICRTNEFVLSDGNPISSPVAAKKMSDENDGM